MNIARLLADEVEDGYMLSSIEIGSIQQPKRLLTAKLGNDNSYCVKGLWSKLFVPDPRWEYWERME